ncbi:MAG: transposase [Deltaproteobacteria bacterium]|nr:transposase [Deltaproteobacteria bacterium]
MALRWAIFDNPSGVLGRGGLVNNEKTVNPKGPYIDVLIYQKFYVYIIKVVAKIFTTGMAEARINRMSQSLTCLYVHVVFSTRKRQNFLYDEVLRGKMHAYLASVLGTYDSPPLIVGGMADHVHLLCRLSRKLPLAKVVGKTKRYSSKWAKAAGEINSMFQWQDGYGAFSVSASRLAIIREYILNQEKHHSRLTFQDELRGLLKKHDIKFNEADLWD